MRSRANPAVTATPGPGEHSVLEELEWWTFDSSRVYEAGYSAQTGQLFVRFQRPTAGQVTYVYNGVETNEWRNFRRSQSPGKFVNRVLNSKNYHEV